MAAEKSGKGMRLMLLTLLAGLAAALVAIVAPPASAADVVQPGRTIEAFIGANLVDLQNYPANRSVDVEVVRDGVVVGSFTGTTDEEGFLEINHTGGGQFPDGDCFKPPETPDIVAGDVIRTTVQGETVSDSATVRDLFIDFATITTNVDAGTITVSGHAVGTADAPIVPGQDVLELRLNKGSADVWDSNGRRDLREDVGTDVQPDGTFTHVFNVSKNDAQDWQRFPGEVFLEWSAAAVGEEEALPPAIFVADEGEGPVPGCPPLNGQTAPPGGEEPPVEEPVGELKVQTDLTGSASGRAQYERKGADQRFAVELKNGPANAELTILIDGLASSEQLSLNNKGEGKLQTQGTGDAVIDGIKQGSLIELKRSTGALVASGTFR